MSKSKNCLECVMALQQLMIDLWNSGFTPECKSEGAMGRLKIWRITRCKKGKTTFTIMRTAILNNSLAFQRKHTLYVCSIWHINFWRRHTNNQITTEQASILIILTSANNNTATTTTSNCSVSNTNTRIVVTVNKYSYMSCVDIRCETAVILLQINAKLSVCQPGLNHMTIWCIGAVFIGINKLRFQQKIPHLITT